MRLKHIKGAEETVLESKHVIELEPEIKGKIPSLFQNNAPIHIEIGTGKGRFLMELAKRNPSINYIGIEKYSSVLLRAVQKMDELLSPLPNLKFICNDAELLPEYFLPGQVEKIYLNFSDPWPKDRHAKRRLTSHQFLERYDKFLAASGNIEFKTDNTDLFMFSLAELNMSNWIIDAFTYDLHNDALLNKDNIMTEYEERFSSQGNKICKLIAHR